MENPEFFFRNNINSMHLICLVHQLLMSDLSKAEFSPFEREWYSSNNLKHIKKINNHHYI